MDTGEEEWYLVSKSAEQLGPLTLDGVKKLWKVGTIDETVLVWREGSS